MKVSLLFIFTVTLLLIICSCKPDHPIEDRMQKVLDKGISNFSCGKKAIGHGGGNIGTTTYMVYLPKYHVSIVVMANAFPNKSADFITKGLIGIVLKELNAIGFISYLPLPIRLFMVSCSIFVIIQIILYKRKKKRIAINHRCS